MIQLSPTRWEFESRTDKSEPRHHVDALSGRLYCTCRGFVTHRHCSHVKEVEDAMNENERAVVLRESHLPELADHQTPGQIQRRLEELKIEKGLIAQFFKDMMVPGVDYGVIPGTGDKAALLKPGAEKLCDLLGLAITVKHTEETIDNATGFLRVVTTVALVSRSNGMIVAEGVGEANTREARYYWRWLTMQKCRDIGIDPVKLGLATAARRSGNSTFTVYRVENDDPYTLWNTIRKMSKKRALVDATLPATRSAGIFTTDVSGIKKWAEAEWKEIDLDEDDENKEEEPYREGLERAEAASAATEKAADAAGVGPATPRIFAQNGAETSLADAQEALRNALANAYSELPAKEFSQLNADLRGDDFYKSIFTATGMQPNKATREQAEAGKAYIDGAVNAFKDEAKAE